MNKSEAEIEVAKILRQLEIDTGCHVASIDLHEPRFHTMGIFGETIFMSGRGVDIDLRPEPGKGWEIGEVKA